MWARLLDDRLSQLLAVLVVAAILASAVALKSDADGFVGNLAAEVVGVAVSIILAVLAVDVLLERRRTQRWADVRDVTLRAIYQRVTDAAVDAVMNDQITDAMKSKDPPDRMPGETRQERFWDAVSSEEPSQPGAVDALEDLASLIREHSEQYADDPDLNWASSRALYDEVHEEISQLRDVLTPRVLELADDPELVRRLLAVESADRAWRGSLWSIEGDWGMPERYAWGDAATFYDAVAAVARHLSETYYRPSSP